VGTIVVATVVAMIAAVIAAAMTVDMIVAAIVAMVIVAMIVAMTVMEAKAGMEIVVVRSVADMTARTDHHARKSPSRLSHHSLPTLARFLTM
jgi:hypothetical protein